MGKLERMDFPQLQLPPGVNRRYTIFASVLLAVIWLWVAFDRPYSFPSHVGWDIYSDTPQSFFQHQYPSTQRDVFDYPPVDSEAIRSICTDTSWNSSIVFTCDESVGGVGNIRNSILNCVRYAISAGAGLVLPRIIVRNSEDIARIRTGERTEMGYMFDKQHFVDSIAVSCPGLRLYEGVDEVDGGGREAGGVPLLPESLVKKIPKTGLSHPEAWRGMFYAWLQENAPSSSSPAPSSSIVINLGRSYLQYPIYSDGAAFALTLGSILKFRTDVRVLATTVLQRMTEKQYPDKVMNLSSPILHNTFFGIHLRTEQDARKAWPAADWMYQRYETQAALYLNEAEASNAKTNMSLLYIASGNASEIQNFAEDAKNRDEKMVVISKLDLLSRKELGKLAWDQQGMVDFLVMTKASRFVGIGHSSFAWNVALRRHVYSEEKGDYLGGPQMLGDELSVVFGAPRGYPEYAACLWP